MVFAITLLINEYFKTKATLYHTAIDYTIENRRILSIDPSPLWHYSVRFVIDNKALVFVIDWYFSFSPSVNSYNGSCFRYS